MPVEKLLKENCRKCARTCTEENTKWCILERKLLQTPLWHRVGLSGRKKPEDCSKKPEDGSKMVPRWPQDGYKTAFETNPQLPKP